MTDIDKKLAEERARIGHKLSSLSKGLKADADEVNHISLARAPDLLPVLLVTIEEIETAIRKFDRLLWSPPEKPQPSAPPPQQRRVQGALEALGCLFLLILAAVAVFVGFSVLLPALATTADYLGFH